MIPPSVNTPSTSRTSNSRVAQRSARLGDMSSDLGRRFLGLIRWQEAKHVGNVQEADRPAFGVDNRQLADFAFPKDFHGIDDSAADGDGDGIGRHDLADGPIKVGVAALLKEAG